MPKAGQSVWLVVWLLCSDSQLASAQVSETRIVIGTNVACRAQPGRDSPAVTAHRLGEPFAVRDRAPDSSDDAAWYEVIGFGAPCWVFGPLTAPFEGYQNPDAALLAAAEHALELADDAGFEHLVAIDNLLLERKLRRGRFLRAPAAVPPMLELRHLQVLYRAARVIGGRRVTQQEPLKRSWVLAHSNVVTYFEPGDFYHVGGSHFWKLHEQYAASPDAEQIAWTAAETPVFTDECYTLCHLSVLAQTHMSYWRRFPGGNHVGEAITTGVSRVERAAGYCVLISAEYLTEDRERIRTLVADVRASLQDLAVAGKDDLLAHLSEIEDTCLGSRAELENPLAIPRLAQALGLGFARVIRSLADFGEEAAPMVLDVVMAQDPDLSKVSGGLTTLRFMVEGSAHRPLSARTLDRIQQAAEQWLAERPQSILTLGAAIDLAAVLENQDLRRVLESLASDPDAVASRGIGAPGSIETIQRRAAERLAGVPPRPRP